MTMPTDILERLRESAVAVAEPGGEHREDGRIPLGTTVTVTVSPVDAYSSMTTMTMRVSDFSSGGVGLLTGDSVPIGCEVTVYLPKRAGGETLNFRCSVCSCRMVADGVYRVGVRYEGVDR